MQRTLARRAGILALSVPILFGALLSGCKGNNSTADVPATPPAATPAVPTPAVPTPMVQTTTAATPVSTSPLAPPTAAEIAAVQKQKAPLVTIVTAKGTILIKLFPKDAPISCANFENLVQKGFYNGLTFHRITDLGAPGQSKIVQGGDPAGDGSGGPGYTIKGEFSSNGVQNTLLHNAGAVAMARTGEPDTAGSQFYICVNPVHDLDGNYAVFGQVIKGLDVAGQLVVGDKMTSVTLSK